MPRPKERHAGESADGLRHHEQGTEVPRCREEEYSFDCPPRQNCQRTERRLNSRAIWSMGCLQGQREGLLLLCQAEWLSVPARCSYGPDQQTVEIQVRTQEAEVRAEYAEATSHEAHRLLRYEGFEVPVDLSKVDIEGSNRS